MLPQPCSGTVHVVKVAHEELPQDAPVQHILYNGVDHYDALVEVADLAPAWEQPPPAQYLAQAIIHYRPLAVARQKRPSKRFQAPRPAAKRPKTTGPTPEAAPKAPAAKRARQEPPARPVADQASSSQAQPEAACEVPEVSEPAQEEAQQPGDDGTHHLLTVMAQIPVQETSLHPHRLTEDAIKDGPASSYHARPCLPGPGRDEAA